METASQSATALLALMKLKRVGRRAALRVVSGIGHDDGQAYKDAIFARAERAKFPLEDLREAWMKAEDEIGRSLAASIGVLSFFDEEYPSRLKDIPDPPAVLFVRGDRQSLYAPRSLAIVGTREPTSYGQTVAQRTGKAVAEFGIVVVSGLALGCDAFGHEGCLDGNGVGVAVMAHGLDRIYPATNRKLGERLLEKGGCLVSEYPIGMKPAPNAFAERDRIQSGLSDAVLVIETDVKGGTMHTVRFARDQHRALACIAHPDKWLSEEKTRGNQKLIADKWAKPIPDGQALVEFIEHLDPSLSSGILKRATQESWTF